MRVICKGEFPIYFVNQIQEIFKTDFIDVWKSLAIKNGLKGIYFVALSNSTSTIRRDESGNLTRVLPDLKSSAGVYNDLLALGFDGINSWGKSRAEILSQGSIH